MFLPDHYIAPFSQNFATQMEAPNLQASPLSQDPEESLVIFNNPGMPILKRPTRLYLDDIVTNLEIYLRQEIPGKEYLRCFFDDITRVKALFKE